MFTPQEQSILRILIAAVTVGFLVSVYKWHYLESFENDRKLDAIGRAIEARKVKNLEQLVDSTEKTVRNKVKIININTAGKEDLESIPGIGPVTADRIIAFREKSGRIRDLKHLQNVNGIGPKTAEKIEPYVIF